LKASDPKEIGMNKFGSKRFFIANFKRLTRRSGEFYKPLFRPKPAFMFRHERSCIRQNRDVIVLPYFTRFSRNTKPEAFAK
jgi:hypothetical protein